MKNYKYSIIILVLLACSCQTKKDKKSSLPNVIIVFTDDQGYGDVGSYGATGFVTPNLDRLATQGMRFTNFYSGQPVCSASRAGLLTGCYPNRLGISGALFPDSEVGLNPNEITIAEMLKQKGYATAIFGKWHLGHRKKFLPLQHGFDEYTGVPYSNDMWPVNLDGTKASADTRKGKYPDLPIIEGDNIVETITSLSGQDKLTTLYTEKAVDFINRNKENPFFLYVPHSMPHTPLGVSDKFRGKSERGMYGDVIMEIDWSVGEIMKALKENDLEDNTIVIFNTDNGPWLNYGNHGGSAGGLREGKTTSWEGGQRVPCIVRWPKTIPEGVVCNQLASSIDFFPTLASIVNAGLPEHKIDGVNIMELWKGNFDAKPRDEIYYYHGKNNLNAVRKDNWKLVFPHTYRSYEATVPSNDGVHGRRIKTVLDSMELYNMMRDEGERYNVIDLYPEIVAELLKVADRARADLGDLNTGAVGSGVREIGKLN